MPKAAFPVPPSRRNIFAGVASALLVLAAANAEAQAPQVPRSLQPTPAPGSLQSGQAELVPVFETSTLVRFMKKEQVRVSPDGRTEFKNVLPSSHCSDLAPGASKQVRLPDYRFGVKNNVPRSVAGIPVADVKTTFVAFFVLEPGFAVNQQVPGIGPGETKMFTAPRREPVTIQVTKIDVPARVRPTPPPTPAPSSSGGGTTAIRITQPRSPTELANDQAQVRCVASVFVQDGSVLLNVDPDKVVKETNENNNIGNY